MRLAPLLVTIGLLTGCGLMLDPGPDASPLDGGSRDASLADAAPRDASTLETCGAVTCGAGLVCCNESCGICAAPDEGCLAIECVDGGPGADAGPYPDGGSACGTVSCSPTQLCCPGCGTDMFCAAGPTCPAVSCPLSCTSSAGCGDEEFCQRPSGTCSTRGTCAPRPTGCPEDCPGVCTCTGRTFCNTCTAQAAGEQVEHFSACGGPRECEPMDARSEMGCVDTVGFAWNGFSCQEIACSCVGTECDLLFSSRRACQLTFGDCSCGGFAGIECRSDEWCEYPRTSACGFTDASGGCRLRPEGCAGPLDPVCGCDGVTYSSACEANAVGVDANYRGPCPMAMP